MFALGIRKGLLQNELMRQHMFSTLFSSILTKLVSGFSGAGYEMGDRSPPMASFTGVHVAEVLGQIPMIRH